MPRQPISMHYREKNAQMDRPVVLVVEDHAATQRILASVLQLHGYRSYCTRNGQEALEWLDNAEQYPDVILLDQRGVGLSSPELACPSTASVAAAASRAGRHSSPKCGAEQRSA